MRSLIRWSCILFSDVSTAKLKQQPIIQMDKQVIEDVLLFAANQLLLAVHKQRKVILVDCGSGNVLAELVLQEQPEFLCKINANLAATTFMKNTIQFIKVNKNTLKADSTTNVDFDAYGIAPYRNNIVVSSSSAVKIISKDGTPIHMMDNTTAGREVFKNPRWITTTTDGSIYVTDWGTDNITRLDSSLTILQTFSGAILNGPCELRCLNNDQLVVCCYRNNTIVLVRPSTSSMTVLLDKQSGIEGPKYLCFCKEQKKMYVARADKILVYKFTWFNYICACTWCELKQTRTDTSDGCFIESVPVYRMLKYNYILGIRVIQCMCPIFIPHKSRNKVTDIRDRCL